MTKAQKTDELNSTVTLTADQIAENADRATRNWMPKIAVKCECGCNTVSPFATQDELAVARWTVYSGPKAVRAPQH